MSRFYVTTPIYYVNDVPHLGTAYTTIAVDALRRYGLSRGRKARMLTGTDEHGLKLEREAKKRGVAPGDFVRDMSDRFRATWPKFRIEADDFIRTTEPRHQRGAQWIWEEIRRRNPDDIYLGSYEGWYCVGCEELKTEKELDQPGNLCAIHKTPVERVKEPSYFFRLEKYQRKLLEHYEKNPEFVLPRTRLNEVVSFVEGGLRDLSISRTTFSWGIPVPGDPKHVMYVWFDALTNYWTALQDTDDHKKYWGGEPDARIVHVIGKDILRFHAVHWPAMLMSAGLPLPTTVFAHGWLTVSGQKMSKSLRNAVEPVRVATAFGHAIGGDELAGADVLRYQLLKAVSFGQDGDFDPAAMIERYNADLGKNVGNLLSRTLSLCLTLSDGKVPPRLDEAEPDAGHEDALAYLTTQPLDVAKCWDAFEPHRALELTMAFATYFNGYIDRRAPWSDPKKGRADRARTTLAVLLEALRCLSVMLWPVVPGKSDEMRKQLGLAPLVPGIGKDEWETPAKWREGDALDRGASLFPVIDAEKSQALLGLLAPPPPETIGEGAPAGSAEVAPVTGAKAAASAATDAAAITYDQFATVDLRVGLVRTCERVPKKDKLLKLSVELGEPAPRTIIAGLALSFAPETLVGRRVIVVANLAPRDFGKGLVSHGMILATGPSEALTLATVEGEVAPGAKLK
jgi:methionyl-tRNA synthetase